MKKRVQGFLLAISLIGLFLLVKEADAAAKTTITVATDSDTAPFTYKEDDKFKGYDIDLVKAIFKDSKKYKLKFQTVPFDSILTGLDAGKYQMAANDFNYNEERAEKYVFSDPVSKSNYAITSSSGKTYKRLDDLSGKSTEVLSGSNYAQVLENWNAANPDKKAIDINYVSGTTGVTSRLQHIENGKIDFILYDAISSAYIVDDQGLDLKVNQVEEQIGGETDGLEYLLLPKDEEGEKLQQFVNKRLAALKKDGTLAKLSKKYFGGDYVSDL